MRIQGTKVRPPCKISHPITSATYAKPLATVLATTKSNIFVPYPLTNPQVNQFTDQFAALLGPKKSSMPGQLRLSNPHVPQQQSLPQFNFHNATQLPNTHLPINFSSSLNRNVNPPPIIAPHHLFKSQVPIIPLIMAPQVPTFNEPPQNPVCSPQIHPLPCPNATSLTLTVT